MDILERFLSNLSCNKDVITQDMKKDFEKERLSINIKREFVTTGILVLLNIMILLVDFWGFYRGFLVYESHKFMFFIHILAISFFTVYIFLTYKCIRIKNTSLNMLRFLHINFCLTISALGVITMLSSEDLAGRSSIYFTSLLCVLPILILNRTEILVTLVTPFLTLICSLVFQYFNVESIMLSFLFICFTFVFAFSTSLINFHNYRGEFIKRHIIASKNNELQSLREALEEILQIRTSELNKIREYEKLRGFFFANISHELRTPLNLISSSIQVMERCSNLDSKQEKYVKLVKQNCYRLTKIITNIIDLTKIDSNHIEFTPNTQDIIRVIEDITLSVVDYAKNKNITLTFDTEIEELIMTFDADKIERIVLNLLSNAIKFTENNGSIMVKLCVKDDTLNISVKDNGIGVPKESQAIIFERFVQVDPSIRRRNEGSGIGLSLVKSLVDMHGGHVELISKLGEGSEFIVSLPITLLEQSSTCPLYENFTTQQEKITMEFSDM